MNELFLQSLAESAGHIHPDCVRARNEQEDYNASQSAALVAVALIGAARVICNLDAELTHYFAQYLVDMAGKEDEMDQISQFTMENCVQYLVENVLNRKEDSQADMDQQRCKLTVKVCLKCAFKKGIPRGEQWAHLGCVFKVPPFASHIPRVPIKGEVYETTNLGEALQLLMQQPVGAKLHVLKPELDSVGKGIYDGPSGNGTSCYVGLRDVIIVGVGQNRGKTVVEVQIFYKKEISFVNVSVDRRISLPLNGNVGDETQVREPTCLLVDFCVPRLSTN